MKAVIWPMYGGPDVLKVQDMKAPTPKHNELLIKIIASAVTTGDCRMRRFDVPSGFWLPARFAFGLLKPRKNIIGMDFSGEVVGLSARQPYKYQNITGLKLREYVPMQIGGWCYHSVLMR